MFSVEIVLIITLTNITIIKKYDGLKLLMLAKVYIRKSRLHN